MYGTTTTQSTRGRRPRSAYVTVGLLGFLGLSALAGGVALVSGGSATPPTVWLDEIPLVGSWLVPGLVLGIGFGLGSLVAAYGILRRPSWFWLRSVERTTHHHWSWIATILIGVGQIAWIGVELIYLPDLSVLQLVYGTTGVLLALLPVLTSTRDYLKPTPARHSDVAGREGVRP